jgi:hypothetical protein
MCPVTDAHERITLGHGGRHWPGGNELFGEDVDAQIHALERAPSSTMSPASARADGTRQWCQRRVSGFCGPASLTSHKFPDAGRC